MDSPQAVVFESSSRTIIAHGLPTVPSTHSVVLPSTTNQEYVASTATNIVDTVSKIAKEAGEMLKGVPYVKALAGIIIQIIKIREVRELAGERDFLTFTRRSGNPNGEGSITGTHRQDTAQVEGYPGWAASRREIFEYGTVEGRRGEIEGLQQVRSTILLLMFTITYLPSAVSLSRFSQFLRSARQRA
jgi:hypothetical protein